MRWPCAPEYCLESFQVMTQRENPGRTQKNPRVEEREPRYQGSQSG